MVLKFTKIFKYRIKLRKTLQSFLKKSQGKIGLIKASFSYLRNNSIPVFQRILLSKNIWKFYKKHLQYYHKFAGSRKHVICSKCDLSTFDRFQTKPLWKLEILQTLLILKIIFLKVIKAHSYFFRECFLIIFMRQTLTDDFWGLHKKKNCL